MHILVPNPKSIEIDSLNLHSNCFRGSPPKRIRWIHMKENATAKLLKCRDSFYWIDRMRGRSDSVTLKKTTSDNWQDNPKSVDGSHQNQDIKRSNDVVFARKFFTSSTTPFTSSYSPALIDSNVSTNIMEWRGVVVRLCNWCLVQTFYLHHQSSKCTASATVIIILMITCKDRK